jgi:hypothetical protein
LIEDDSLIGFWEETDERLTSSSSNIDEHYVEVWDDDLEDGIMNVTDGNQIGDDRTSISEMGKEIQ